MTKHSQSLPPLPLYLTLLPPRASVLFFDFGTAGFLRRLSHLHGVHPWCGHGVSRTMEREVCFGQELGMHHCVTFGPTTGQVEGGFKYKIYKKAKKICCNGNKYRLDMPFIV